MITPAELARRIEDMPVLDRISKLPAGLVQRITSPTAVRNALSGTWLGHQLHPMLTDLPIGSWTLASVLDLTMGRRGVAAARRLVGFGVLTALPAAATGASDWSYSNGAVQRVGLVHALANSAGTALQVASWVARGRGRRLTGMLLTTAGLCFTAAAGYLGGHLTLIRGVGVNRTAFQPAVADWTDVGALTELIDGRPTHVEAAGVPVVLVRSGAAVRALSATCVHAGGPLDQGELVDGDCLRCPWHGSTFRLTDGAVVRGPAANAQPCWAVRFSGGRVQIRTLMPRAGSLRRARP